METYKLNVISDGSSIVNYFRDLPEELKEHIFALYTFEEIVQQIERQLKHETDIDGWDTSGYRDGAKMREAVIKFQGLEPEFKKDLESRIRSLESDVANYEKYYNWYFKLWRIRTEGNELHNWIDRVVGWKIDK